MSANVQEIRGNTSLVSTYAGPIGQVAVNTDDFSIHVQDGSTDGGWIAGGAPVNSQTGTSYTVLASDQGKLVRFSNSSAVVCTLPAAGAGNNFQNGAKVWLLNLGVGTVTVDPASGTINGVSSITLVTGQGALVVSDGTNYYAIRGASSATGTVTSAALSMPSIFSVSGSPITTSGTFTVTLATETTNYIFAGPSSGSSAAPTFRAMVAADLPASAVTQSSTLTANTIIKGTGSASVQNSLLTDNGTTLTYPGAISFGTASLSLQQDADVNYVAYLSGGLRLAGNTTNLSASIPADVAPNGNALIGWNYTAGGAETDLICGRNGTGFQGGFALYDYDGTTVTLLVRAAVSSGTQIKGTPTNDNANAGYVGEIITSYVASGSAVSLTSAIQANVTSITLTPGDWQVYGTVGFVFASSTSYTDLLAAFSTSSASVDLSLSTCSYSRSSTSGVIPGSAYADLGMPTGTRRISVSTNTTVYLIGYSIFTVSTLAAYGFIEARRMR